MNSIGSPTARAFKASSSITGKVSPVLSAEPLLHQLSCRLEKVFTFQLPGSVTTTNHWTSVNHLTPDLLKDDACGEDLILKRFLTQ